MQFYTIQFLRQRTRPPNNIILLHGLTPLLRGKGTSKEETIMVRPQSHRHRRTQQASFSKSHLWILSLLESLPQMAIHWMIAQLWTKCSNHTIMHQDTSGIWFLKASKPTSRSIPLEQRPNNWIIVSSIRNQGTGNRLHNFSDNGLPSSCPNQELSLVTSATLELTQLLLLDSLESILSPNLALGGPRGCQWFSQEKVSFQLPILCLTQGWIKLLMPKIFLTVQEAWTGTFIYHRAQTLLSLMFRLSSSLAIDGDIRKMFLSRQRKDGFHGGWPLFNQLHLR